MYTKYMASTIRVSDVVKEKIASFGLKGESYDKILDRMYELAIRERRREFLMPSEKYISLDEFEKEVNKKWPKSK
jgi:hypothetical protein